MFLAFVGLMALLEQLGVSRWLIGGFFLLGTVVVYAVIGIVTRTSDPDQYYVAGRQVPAFYNGMATAADWMSAASFIGVAGTLYLSGFNGLAYILGWTGGFVLVAILLAPYIRKFGRYTLPDFLATRYQGEVVRVVSVVAIIVVSFGYLVAQIYGVGLITSRMTGAGFELGVFLGVGGILVCSFLGGMRAVTYTQVAQYVVLILAFTLPVMWLSVKQTGSPVAQLHVAQQLKQVTQAEERLQNDPAEKQVRDLYAQRAAQLSAQLRDPVASLERERQQARQRLETLQAEKAPMVLIRKAERNLARQPLTVDQAVKRWRSEMLSAEHKSKPLAGMPAHAQPYAGDPNGTPIEQSTFQQSRLNFMALVLCLMMGTASLPHVLVRFYTTPSVGQARQSVAWTLFFVVVLYLSAPVLAIMIKHEVFHHLVGMPFDALPAWLADWGRVDPKLLSMEDINADGFLQLSELYMGSDIMVLAASEIAQMPYVITALVAAGALAAALSTADGLLLTLSNALSHDTYYHYLDPHASTAKRVTAAKILLLVLALLAAYVATQKPGDLLFMVSVAFSLAAAAFFPALVLGIFWRRANGWGAASGMLGGLGVTGGYILWNASGFRAWAGLTSTPDLLWGIEPISAGVLGVPVGLVLIVLVSALTGPPQAIERSTVAHLRRPPNAL